MDYHLIHLMPREDQNFCFVDKEPEGIGINYTNSERAFLSEATIHRTLASS